MRWCDRAAIGPYSAGLVAGVASCCARPWPLPVCARGGWQAVGVSGDGRHWCQLVDGYQQALEPWSAPSWVVESREPSMAPACYARADRGTAGGSARRPRTLRVSLVENGAGKEGWPRWALDAVLALREVAAVGAVVAAVITASSSHGNRAGSAEGVGRPAGEARPGALSRRGDRVVSATRPRRAGC